MNKIPLSVSSSLTNKIGMSTLSVVPFANQTGKTGTAAPVLIAVESEGTIGVEAFAEALPNKGGQGTAAQARLVVNALAGVLSDLVAEYGAITVNTPLGRIDTFVAGSLEYATDPVDPAVNVPFLGIVPGADVMKEFAKMEAFVPTAACPASLKRVRDVATGGNAIHGANAFYAQGYGLTYGGTGETVKLLNALTRAEVCTVSVDTATKSEAQLKCTLPTTAAIAAGTYILQVTTLAGGTQTLWPLELKVNLAEAVTPPQLTGVSKESCTLGESQGVTGTNLPTFDFGAGIQPYLKFKVRAMSAEEEFGVTSTAISGAGKTGFTLDTTIISQILQGRSIAPEPGERFPVKVFVKTGVTTKTNEVTFTAEAS